MTQIYKIYDPITLQTHVINLDEIRCWLNIDVLQQYMKQPQYKQEFYNLNPEAKQDFLTFLDNHDKPLKFRLNPMTEHPYLDFYFSLNIYHAPSVEKFYDSIKASVRDNIFFEKEIQTTICPAELHIENAIIPFESFLAISNEFIQSENLSYDDSFYIENNEAEFEKFSMIDKEGTVSPVTIKYHIHKEYKWLFELTINIQTKLEHKNIVWAKTPRIKALTDFFRQENFRISKQDDMLLVWENNGSVVEHYQLPMHDHEPFVIIRSHEYKEDYEVRNTYGKYLLEKMSENGVLEEITFYRGSRLLANALDKIKIKNKMPADILLSESIMVLDQCNDFLYPIAQVEIAFCAWLKNRIANLVQDEEVKMNSYRKIAKTLVDLRAFEHLKWFLMKIYREDKKEYALKIIKELLPLKLLDKHYFISNQSYKQLLQLWDFAQYEEKCPEHLHASEWHYHIAKQAQNIGLKNVANKRFRAFCKASEKEIEDLKWAIEGTDDLLELAMKVSAQKEYLDFSIRMSEHYEKKRKNQRIGDLDAVGRKAYRWTVFTWSMAEMRWSFHAAYLLSKQEKPNKSDIQRFYNKAYQAFHDGILSYDPTETYLIEQLQFIAQSFLTAYHMAFTLRDENTLEYIYSLATELWNNYPLQEIYDILNILFYKKERENMADRLIDSWKEKIIEEYGEFEINLERALFLVKVYISVEEWNEAANTIHFVLDNFSIDYDTLNKIYEMYRSIESFFPEIAEICGEKLIMWIDVYKNQTSEALQYMPTLVQRINKIKTV